MIKQVCLYCNEHLGSIEEPGDDTERISHGVCPRCFPKLLAGSGKPLAKFLDSLPAPVFVVDQDVRIVTANALGRELISKDLEEMRGHLGGEVFSCKYSKMPGGCGQTVHCKACTIRKTVTKTYKNGRPCTRVPAYMDLGDYTGDKTVRFLISTEKVENVVFLRIDDSQAVDPTEGGEQCPV